MAPPAETLPQADGAPNHIGRSVAALVRGTQRALSPWLQRLFRAHAGPVPGPAGRPALRRRLQPGGPAAAPLRFGARPLGQAGLTVQRLAGRIQRNHARPTAWQAGVSVVGPTVANRFVTSVARRFPEVAAKYQAQTMRLPAAPSAQRSALPFVQAPSETGLETDSFAGAEPASDVWVAEPTQAESGPLPVSPGESLTARLRTVTHGAQAVQRAPEPDYAPPPPKISPDESLTDLLRNITHGPQDLQRAPAAPPAEPEALPPQPAPRAVSRRASEAARAARGEASGGRVRRAVIEEITPAQPPAGKPEASPGEAAPPAGAPAAGEPPPPAETPAPGAEAAPEPSLPLRRAAPQRPVEPAGLQPAVQRQAEPAPAQPPPPPASSPGAPAIQRAAAPADPSAPSERPADVSPRRPAPRQRPAAPAQGAPAPPSGPPPVQRRAEAGAPQPDAAPPAGPPESPPPSAPIETGSLPLRTLQRKSSEPLAGPAEAPVPGETAAPPEAPAPAAAPPPQQQAGPSIQRTPAQPPRRAAAPRKPDPGLPPGAEPPATPPAASTPRPVQRSPEQDLPLRAPGPPPIPTAPAPDVLQGGVVPPQPPGPSRPAGGAPSSAPIQRQAAPAPAPEATPDPGESPARRASTPGLPAAPVAQQLGALAAARRNLPMVRRQLAPVPQMPRTAVLPQTRVQRAPDEGGGEAGPPANGGAQRPAGPSPLPLQLWRAPYGVSESRSQPVTAIIPGASGQPAGEASVALSPAPPRAVQRKPAPAPPARPPARSPIRRKDDDAKPDKAAAASGDEDDDEDEGEDKDKKKSPDLAALARKVYPLIKRMLAVERERR